MSDYTIREKLRMKTDELLDEVTDRLFTVYNDLMESDISREDIAKEVDKVIQMLV